MRLLWTCILHVLPVGELRSVQFLLPSCIMLCVYISTRKRMICNFSKVFFCSTLSSDKVSTFPFRIQYLHIAIFVSRRWGLKWDRFKTCGVYVHTDLFLHFNYWFGFIQDSVLCIYVATWLYQPHSIHVSAHINNLRCCTVEFAYQNKTLTDNLPISQNRLIIAPRSSV